MSVTLRRFRFGATHRSSRISTELTTGSIGVLIQSYQEARVATSALAGLVRPPSGSVLVDGQNPYRAPAIRAQIGCVFPFEHATLQELQERYRLELGATVSAAWERARALRGARGVQCTKGPLLLGKRHGNRPLASLSLGEIRRLEIDLAVQAEQPKLLVVTDLFRDLSAAEVLALGHRLKDVAERGIVLVLDPSRDKLGLLSQRRLEPEGGGEP